MPAVVRFEPAQYSLQDLAFLLDHLGTSPTLAFRRPLPPGTHRNRIEEVLQTVYEYDQLQDNEEGFRWAGKAALVDAIQRFLAWHDRSREIQRRQVVDAAGALVSHPSMYAWDEDGKAYKFAVGADSSEMVRTEILDDGSRRPFGVTLAHPQGDTLPRISDIAPWVKGGPEAPRHDDKVTEIRTDKSSRTAFLECSVCGHREKFDTQNPGTRRAAMARMYNHLRRTKEKLSRHQILLTKLGR